MTETFELMHSRRPALVRLLSDRMNLLIFALIVIGAGAAFKRSWLTAIGVAPLILSFAPCAIMCATGYCCVKSDRAVIFGRSFRRRDFPTLDEATVL